MYIDTKINVYISYPVATVVTMSAQQMSF